MGAGGGPSLDKKVSQVLWERVQDLSPEDLAAIDKGMNRELGLLLLKIVPELSTLILNGSQMQGPEMKEVRDQFNHDAIVNHLKTKMGAGAVAGPQPADAFSGAAPGAAGPPPSARGPIPAGMNTGPLSRY